MSKVFVVDATRLPLDPVHPGYARLLLKQRKAAVLRNFPFTIVLNVALEQPEVQPLRIKLDPGSKTTGLAIVNDATGEVVFAAEITHRGQQIKHALDGRRRVRRGRRQRHTRYRQARFANRRRPKGWLPPSIESRVANVLTWVKRLMRICPLTAISQEVVKFDMQAMERPEISGFEYQQGTLEGYEVREYLLEKWGRACAYCGQKEVQLQVEHIQCRAKGGSDRISNLTLACEPCNLKKGTQDIAVFLAKKPDLLKRIQAQAKAPLKDAAAVNASRWALYHRLATLGLPVECGTGGRTKFNRLTRGMKKTHWQDAACVGASTPEIVHIQGIMPLSITATGSGCRQKCQVNAIGFPCSRPKGAKKIKGFQTGIWFGRWSPLERNKGCMWDACWSGRVVPSTSKPNKAESRGSAFVSVRQCIVAMGIVMPKDPATQTSPLNPPDKERSFLPGLQRPGHPGPTLVKQPIEGLLLSNAIRPGVIGLAKTLSVELASYQITVNNVCPGRILTDRLRQGPGIRAKIAQGQTEEEALKELARDIPLQRVGQPRELGALVAFLASQQAAYITGTTIQVDGGFIQSIF